MRRFHALLIAAGLAAMPASAAAGSSVDSSSTPRVFEKYQWSTSKGRLGVMVMSLTPELRKYLGAPEDRGVLVAHVEPGTPAAAAGIAVGDVIVNVRGRMIVGAADVLAALADVGKGQPVPVEIVRDKKPVSLQATIANEATASPFEPLWFFERMRPWTRHESSLRS